MSTRRKGTGNGLDNAVMENIFGILKCEYTAWPWDLLPVSPTDAPAFARLEVRLPVLKPLGKSERRFPFRGLTAILKPLGKPERRTRSEGKPPCRSGHQPYHRALDRSR